MTEQSNNYVSLNRTGRKGIVLAFVLMVLVVLSSIAYTLSSRVAAQKNRQNYYIDYQNACYGRDSALKYAFTLLEILEPNVISRPNEPDFSDLFALDDESYQKLLRQQAEYLATIETNLGDANDYFAENSRYSWREMENPNDINLNEQKDYFSESAAYSAYPAVDANDPNSVFIPGPYGPPWPCIIEPVELIIGQTAITVEIEDENAKMPLVWAANSDEKMNREVDAAIETFCEWMQMDVSQIRDLQAQLDEIRDIKQLKLDLTSTAAKKQEAAKKAEDPNRTTPKTERDRRLEKMKQMRERRAKIRTRSLTRTEFQETGDFARLLHSGLIDSELLAKPILQNSLRNESPLKYIALWGSQKVNINTAPRNVLEALFTFSGDATDIAESVIQERKIRPFADFEDVKKRLPFYSSAIEKVESLMVMQSDFFTIKVTAKSGRARICTVAAVVKSQNQINKIGLIGN